MVDINIFRFCSHRFEGLPGLSHAGIRRVLSGSEKISRLEKVVLQNRHSFRNTFPIRAQVIYFFQTAETRFQISKREIARRKTSKISTSKRAVGEAHRLPTPVTDDRFPPRPVPREHRKRGRHPAWPPPIVTRWALIPGKWPSIRMIYRRCWVRAASWLWEVVTEHLTYR